MWDDEKFKKREELTEIMESCLGDEYITMQL